MKLKTITLLFFSIMFVSCASLLGVQNSKYTSEKIVSIRTNAPFTP